MSVPAAFAESGPEADANAAAATTDVGARVSDTYMRSISPNLWSLNFSPNGYTTADEFFAKFNIEDIRDTGVKLLRFYGGCKSQYYDWRTPRLYNVRYKGTVHERHTINNNVMGVAEALKVAKAVDARLLFEVNIAMTTDSPDGCRDHPGFDSTVEDTLDLLRRYRGIKFVELGNEPWFSWDPVVYTDRILEYATAIRAEFPAVRIAAPGVPSKAMVYDPTNKKARRINREWTAASRRLSDAMCDNGTAQVHCLDFLTIHQYGRTGYDSEQTASWNFPGVGAYYPIANYALVLEKLRHTHQRGRIALTEWNMRCFGSDAGKANPALHTVEQGFYVLESQLLMVQYNVKVATLLNLSGPPGAPCSMFQPGGGLNIVGEMIKFTAPIAGGFYVPTNVRSSPTRVVETDTTCLKVVLVTCNVGGEYPTISSYSAYSRDMRTLYVYILNKGSSVKTVALSLGTSQTTLSSRNVRMTRLEASSFTNGSFAESHSQITLDPTNEGVTRLDVPAVSIIRLEVSVRPNATGSEN